jgi:hypothetical protein
MFIKGLNSHQSLALKVLIVSFPSKEHLFTMFVSLLGSMDILFKSASLSYLIVMT